MMKGLNLSFRQGKGELVVSSLPLGGKPSRPIGNMVEVRAEGGEREEGREGLLGLDSDVPGPGATWPWDLHFTKCLCNSPFPFRLSRGPSRAGSWLGILRTSGACAWVSPQRGGSLGLLSRVWLLVL